jgi:hypothetical protein
MSGDPNIDTPVTEEVSPIQVAAVVALSRSLSPEWHDTIRELGNQLLRLQEENLRLHEGIDHYRQVARLAMSRPGGHG